MINPAMNPKLLSGNTNTDSAMMREAILTLAKSIYGEWVFVNLNCNRNIGIIITNEAIVVANAPSSMP